jgi:ABC-type antimicrobial peptide transport system permease subunit
LTGAYFAGRLLAFVLWGVTPGDPATFAATFVALSGAGLLACLVPARRAVRVNPVEALRHE